MLNFGHRQCSQAAGNTSHAAREAQSRTGLAIRNLVRQLPPLRSATIVINRAVQTIRAAIPDQQQALLDALKKPRTHALSD